MLASVLRQSMAWYDAWWHIFCSSCWVHMETRGSQKKAITEGLVVGMVDRSLTILTLKGFDISIILHGMAQVLDAKIRWFPSWDANFELLTGMAQNHPPKWTDCSKEHHFTMCVPLGTPLWEPRPAPLTGNELTKHCMHTMCPPQLKVDSQSHLQL